MVRVKLLDGTRLGILFRYFDASEEEEAEPGFDQWYRGVEACLVDVDEKWKPQEVKWVGASYCHGFDNFKKETGRKIALTRALASSTIDKLNRKVVWSFYHLRKVDGQLGKKGVTL